MKTHVTSLYAHIHMYACACVCVYGGIGGGKGGAMGLQPHLILRVLHSILFFTIEIFSCLSISPTWFDYLPPPMYGGLYCGSMG